MNLDPGDCELFFKLHKALMLFVNQRLKVVKPPAKSVKVILPLPPEDRLKVRDAFLKHLDLIDAFVEENPFKLDPEELDTVRSWHDLVAGEFYVFRHLKKYTVFLTAKEPTVAYGVVALSDPFEEVIDQELPFLCKTVLLPFQGRIVYDGLLSGYNLIIGSNIRRELNDAYNDAKKRHGIVTSLPWRAESPKALPKRGTARKKRGKRGRGLIGRWRITWMEAWDQDSWTKRSRGSSSSTGTGPESSSWVRARARSTIERSERDGKPAIEFSWDGNDEMDPPQGRGWAVLDGDEIEGRVFIHRDLDSAFRAVRKGR